MFHFWLRLPTGWVWESGLGSLDFQVVFGHCENSISQKSWLKHPASSANLKISFALLDLRNDLSRRLADLSQFVFTSDLVEFGHVVLLQGWDPSLDPAPSWGGLCLHNAIEVLAYQ